MHERRDMWLREHGGHVGEIVIVKIGERAEMRLHCRTCSDECRAEEGR